MDRSTTICAKTNRGVVLSYSSEDYQADKNAEYLADQAWEDNMEHRLENCECEMWHITKEGIVDVERWEYNKGQYPKMITPMAVIEIKCDFCGKTNYGRVPYSEILKLLSNEFEHTGGLEIDVDGWS